MSSDNYHTQECIKGLAACLDLGQLTQHRGTVIEEEKPLVREKAASVCVCVFNEHERLH